MEVPLSPGAILQRSRRATGREHGPIEDIDIVNAKDRAAPPGRGIVGTIQALQQNDLSVLIAESDVRRLRFAAKIYTIECSAIVHQAKNET